MFAVVQGRKAAQAPPEGSIPPPPPELQAPPQMPFPAAPQAGEIPMAPADGGLTIAGQALPGYSSGGWASLAKALVAKTAPAVRSSEAATAGPYYGFNSPEEAKAFQSIAFAPETTNEQRAVLNKWGTNSGLTTDRRFQPGSEGRMDANNLTLIERPDGTFQTTKNQDANQIGSTVYFQNGQSRPATQADIDSTNSIDRARIQEKMGFSSTDPNATKENSPQVAKIVDNIYKYNNIPYYGFQEDGNLRSGDAARRREPNFNAEGQPVGLGGQTSGSAYDRANDLWGVEVAGRQEGGPVNLPGYHAGGTAHTHSAGPSGGSGFDGGSSGGGGGGSGGGGGGAWGVTGLADGSYGQGQGVLWDGAGSDPVDYSSLSDEDARLQNWVQFYQSAEGGSQSAAEAMNSARVEMLNYYQNREDKNLDRASSGPGPDHFYEQLAYNTAKDAADRADAQKVADATQAYNQQKAVSDWRQAQLNANTQRQQNISGVQNNNTNAFMNNLGYLSDSNGPTVQVDWGTMMRNTIKGYGENPDPAASDANTPNIPGYVFEKRTY